MIRLGVKLAAVLMVPALVPGFCGRCAAQAVLVAPTPTVTYYSPPPVITVPAPQVAYYAAPAVTYYAPSAVVAPAPAAVTTTYRYGILPRRQVTVTTYGTAVPATVVVPRRAAVSYYGPAYVYP